MSQSTQTGTVREVADLLAEKRRLAQNPEEDSSAEQVEDQEDELDNLEEETEEVEDEEEEQPEPESSDDVEENEEQEESTVLDLEDLEGYTFKLHIDGQDSEVTFEELRNGNLKDSDYRKKTSELAEARKKLEDAQAKTGEVQQQYVENLRLIERAIAQPYSAEQLATIRRDQGTDAWAEAQEYNQARRAEVEAIKTEMSKEAQQAQHDLIQQVDVIRAEEKEKLKQVLPEIVEGEGKDRLDTYLGAQGFTNDEIDQAVDHRVFVLAEKARKYDALQKKGAKKAKPKKLKVIRKKASQGKSQVGRKKVSDLHKQAMATGHPRDVAAYKLAKNANQKR